MNEIQTDQLKPPSTVIAVVGATDHQEKFGSIIYRYLKRKGFNVLAVNPSRLTVDGETCYKTVADLPVCPDLINIVTPPHITFEVLRECLKMNYINVWIQPGAADREVIRFIKDHSFAYRVNDCIMMQL